jgi:hypothetical protein
LKQVLQNFLKQPYQDTPEKVLELIKENLHLMEIIKIKNEVFPSLLTSLPKPTKEGILQVFHPFHKITQLYLSLNDVGIDTKISYPRDNSAPIIKLESYIPEANTNLHIAYALPKSKSELPLRREFAAALDAKLQLDSK